MRMLEIVIDHMKHALKESESYYKEYMLLEGTYPEIASVSLDMCEAHMKLFNKWKVAALDFISRIKREKSVPENMEEMWNREYSKLIDDHSELERKLYKLRR